MCALCKNIEALASTTRNMQEKKRCHTTTKSKSKDCLVCSRKWFNWNWCDFKGNKKIKTESNREKKKPLQVICLCVWFCAPTVLLKCAKVLSKAIFTFNAFDVCFFCLEISSQSIELIWCKRISCHCDFPYWRREKKIFSHWLK